MFSKKSTGRAFGAVLGTVFASLITLILGLWHERHVVLAVLAFVGLWVGFYLTGIWALVDRPAELDKKFPISHSEQRRRKKAFWDWVSSLPRR